MYLIKKPLIRKRFRVKVELEKNTNEIGGAAATGSYCVGGWVLRGSLNAGLSASQGASASTLWGEQTLDYLKSGLNAEDAINKVVNVDAGKEHRQLSLSLIHI